MQNRYLQSLPSETIHELPNMNDERRLRVQRMDSPEGRIKHGEILDDAARRLCNIAARSATDCETRTLTAIANVVFGFAHAHAYSIEIVREQIANQNGRGMLEAAERFAATRIRVDIAMHFTDWALSRIEDGQDLYHQIDELKRSVEYMRSCINIRELEGQLKHEAYTEALEVLNFI